MQVLRSLHVVHLSDCTLIEFGQVMLYNDLAADAYIIQRMAINAQNSKLHTLDPEVNYLLALLQDYPNRN